MKRFEVGRAGILLLILGAIILGKTAQEAYDWYAYGEERERLESLKPEFERMGMAVVLSQLRADSVRRGIAAMDGELAELRRGIEAYDRYQIDGRLSPGLFERYRDDLGEYNARVESRNASLRRLEAAMERNGEAVDSFNVLANRIRGIAESMGESYYPLPTPAEIASSRGVSPPGAQLPN